MIVALAAIAFVLRPNHSKPLPAGAAAIAAVRAEAASGKLSAEGPPVTLIDLPSLSQRDEVADSDASDGGTFTIPVYAAHSPINSALLAAQQLAAQRAAFIATGSPGLAMPAGLGAGVALAQSANATGLELGLLSGGGSNGNPAHSASSAVSHSGWVLIAGGQGGGKFALTRAELFDPIQMNFVATGAMHRARAHFVAADLAAGQMLVAGGDDAQGEPTASAELYDPITGQFSPTGAMTVARAGHTATLISGCGCAADGKILIAGGSSTGATAPLASAELYDPDTGSFATTGAMNQARAWQTASLIPSGAVAGDILVAGGVGSKAATLASAEIYDPRTGAFTETTPMSIARAYHTATWLDPSIVTGEFAGQILVAGGSNGDAINDSAEVFDPAEQNFIPAGTMTAARALHAAVLMPTGRVLIAGGEGPADQALATAEIYDPVKEDFTAAAPMLSVHVGGVASMLSGGSVLIAGGRSSNAEVYNPATGNFALTAAMPVDVAYAAGAVIGH